MNQTLYLGFDVHKDSIVIAYALSGGGDPKLYGKCGGSNLAVERTLNRICKRFEVEKRNIRIAYEAGPTGFVLVRLLLQLGYDTIVVAPSKMERAAGDKIKTDKRDAIKIAKQLRGESLSGIYIPDAKNEAVRDLCRARTDASEDLRKDKQRLGSFLIRHGITYSGKTNWSEAHMRYLRKTRFCDPALNFVLEDYIRAVDDGFRRIAALRAKLEEIVEGWAGKVFVDALKAFRSFDTVAAMTVVSEIGDFNRFKHPRQLMSYLGLVPSEETSNQSRRQGAITKCGNSHVRWMLAECAQNYRHDPKVSPQLSKRQEGQPRKVKDLSWRAQVRLNYRFNRLCARQLRYNKVIIAIARELSAFIWELFTSGIVPRAVPITAKPVARTPAPSKFS